MTDQNHITKEEIIVKTELVVQLIEVAELIKKASDLAAALLEQAECELELALDILKDVDSDKAKRFVTRHSTPARSIQAAESVVFGVPFGGKTMKACITSDQMVISHE